MKILAEQFDLSILPENHILHDCKIVSLLGRGGFGVTYKACDINLEKTVAIKEYFPNDIAVRQGDFSIQPISKKYENAYNVGRDNFIQEARTVSRFEHMNFARVNTLFEANNTGYMIMRYEKGQNIKEIRKSRQFTESELLKIVFNILDALELLHNEHYIHRDIKPENIIIRDCGTPVLIDFGSARSAHGQTERDLTCMVSPGYAPIEQYVSNSKSDKQGAWTDIYGLSATLYYMISGIAPSAAINRGDSILRTNRDTYVPIELIAKNQYSKSLLKAIDNGLAFAQNKRPQSIAEWRLMFEPKTLNQGALKIFTHPNQANIVTFPAKPNVDNNGSRNPFRTKGKTSKFYFNTALLSLFIALVMPLTRNGDINGFISAAIPGNQSQETSTTDFTPVDGDKIERAYKKSIKENPYLKHNRVNTTGLKASDVEIDDGNFAAAVATLLPLAKSGKAIAQYDLGIIFFIRDIDESMSWFRKAAEQGYAPAQVKLGFIYDNAVRVAEDNKKAFGWYRLAAEQGNAEAQFMIGMMYMNGEGTNSDIAKADHWLSIAGQKGFENAQETLRQFNQQLKFISKS